MIRQYENVYSNDCVNLFIDVFSAEPWGYKWINEEDIKRYVTDMENTPNFKGFLVFEDDLLCAFCFGVVNDYFEGKTFEIKEFVVHKKNQGKGTGSALLSHMRDYFESDDFDIISLLTRRSIAAYDFYEKNGFSASDDVAFMFKPIN